MKSIAFFQKYLDLQNTANAIIEDKLFFDPFFFAKLIRLRIELKSINPLDFSSLFWEDVKNGTEAIILWEAVKKLANQIVNPDVPLNYNLFIREFGESIESEEASSLIEIIPSLNSLWVSELRIIKATVEKLREKKELDSFFDRNKLSTVFRTESKTVFFGNLEKANRIFCLRDCTKTQFSAVCYYIYHSKNSVTRKSYIREISFEFFRGIMADAFGRIDPKDYNHSKSEGSYINLKPILKKELDKLFV